MNQFHSDALFKTTSACISNNICFLVVGRRGFYAGERTAICPADDPNRAAADEAVLDIVLFGNRQVDNKRNDFPAIRATDIGRVAQRAQKLSLRRRVSANTSTSGAPDIPSVACRFGLIGRRNGLVARSRPMVDGMVA